MGINVLFAEFVPIMKDSPDCSLPLKVFLANSMPLTLIEMLVPVQIKASFVLFSFGSLILQAQDTGFLLTPKT